MANPVAKAGKRYRLVKEDGVGRPGDPGFVDPGTVVTVRELVAADTKGAHNDEEDAVVVEIPVKYTRQTEDGGTEEAETARAFSVSEADFHEWFEAVR